MVLVVEDARAATNGRSLALGRRPDDTETRRDVVCIQRRLAERWRSAKARHDSVVVRRDPIVENQRRPIDVVAQAHVERQRVVQLPDILDEERRIPRRVLTGRVADAAAERGGIAQGIVDVEHAVRQKREPPLCGASTSMCMLRRET